MKLAFITTENNLKLSNEGDIDFCLAQIALKNEKYKDWYSKRGYSNKWRFAYTILDNGAAENELIPNDEYVKLALEMNVDEIIVPDVIGDFEKSIIMLYEFLGKYGWGLHKNDIKIQAVIQGKNQKEYEEYYDILLGEPTVDVIGIPFRMNINAIGNTVEVQRTNARINFVKNIEIVKKSIHCLGCNSPREIIELNKIPYIRSCDSKLMVRYGLNEQIWNINDKIKPIKKLGMEDKLTWKQRIYALRNIQKLKEELK